MPLDLSLEEILRELNQTPRAPDTLERRIELCRQALAQVRREAEPKRWAQLHFERGLCLAGLPQGDKIAHLEAAVEQFGRALEAYTPQSYPQEWGATRRNLARLHHQVGTLYARRAELSGAGDQEQAMAHYRAALETWTEDDFPQAWAQANHDLGSAWFHRIRGDRAENLEHAIACYQAALRVRTPGAYPLPRAETQHNLGLAYLERYREGRADNLERALELLSQAEQVFRQAGIPEKWAKTHSNLGSAYLQRIRGERADSVERAIGCYQEARATQERVGPPEELAATHHNLGVAYAERRLGEAAANLRRAIEHLEQALLGFADQSLRRATVYNDMSDAHWRLGNHLRPSQPAQAAWHYEQALDHARAAAELYQRLDYPRKWALAQHNLGNIYCDRRSGDRAYNLEQGIHHYRQALTVRRRGDYPFEWAQTQNNLGTAFWERVHGVRRENLDLATRCFQDALGVHQPDVFPVDARRAARNLGNLHFEEREWSQAHTAYDQALLAAEVLYRASFSPGGKQAELAENTALYEHLVQVCLEQPDPLAALVAAEGGKARTFLDQMGQGAFPPPPGLPAGLLDREVALIERLRGQEQTLLVLSDQERGVVEERREALTALEAVWDEMAEGYPAARDYVAMRRGEPLSWDDLRGLAARLGPEACLVEFYTLPDEIAVFVLRAGWEEPRVHRAPVSQRWLHDYLESFFQEMAEPPTRPTLGPPWEELSARLLGGVLPHLEDARLVYLIPQGALHYLPLHALEMDGAPLVERFPVAYAPSAAVLGRLIEQAGRQGTNGASPALVVGNPTGDLQYAEREAELVAKRFGITPCLGQAATRRRVLDEIQDRAHVHLACHAHFDADEPLHSGLALHDGLLTAGEILKLRLKAGLMVLSACQTARQTVGRGDELMGLVRVLLYAGASALVASLWSVDDWSTNDLMRCFYDRLDAARPSGGTGQAELLRQAMLAVRRQEGWEHPYYWAPFILVGAG